MAEEFFGITETNEIEHPVPGEYQPLEQGDAHWLQKLDDNFRYIMDQVGDNESIQQAVEALRAEIYEHLDNKTGRDEFTLSQQRQDYHIEALQQALDTGFTGTTVMHTFAENELSHWQGWDGGLPEGALNADNQLTN